MAVFQSKYTGQQVEAILNRNAICNSVELFKDVDGQTYVYAGQTRELENYDLLVCIGHNAEDNDVIFTCMAINERSAVCLNENDPGTVHVDSNGFSITDGGNHYIAIKRLIGIRWIYSLDELN